MPVKREPQGSLFSWIEPLLKNKKSWFLKPLKQKRYLKILKIRKIIV